ncbi:MAG: DUF4091 domain-containing protein [Clostridiales bacterium]|jgi:hypothetical protein|nr:DUF4091 domain-containing protein [Clostridiales bacterium]
MAAKEVFLYHEFLRIDGLSGAFVEGVPESAAIGGAMRLKTVKNQFVAFQIGLRPCSGRLDGLRIELSELADGRGGKISCEGYAVYAEWFHRINGRLIPDLLLPMDSGAVGGADSGADSGAVGGAGACRAYGAGCRIPMDSNYLPDQKAGAVWVDLWIGKAVQAGLYTGAVRVRANGEEHSFSVEAEVYDETLPDKSSITADLNNYADSLSPHFASLKHNPGRYGDGSYLKVEQGFFRMARDHRCLYHNLPYRHSGAMPETFKPELEGEGKHIRVKSWDGFDAHFGPYLDGSAFAGCKNGEHPLEFMYLPFNLGWPASYEKWGQKGYRTEYRRILAEFARHLEDKGWLSTVFEILLNHKKDYRFFPYTVDEIWYEHDQDVVDSYYGIINGAYEASAARIVFRMDSSNHFGNHFDHRFSDYCKMWVAGFGMFNWFPESVPVMREKGNILWIYGSVLQSLEESLGSVFLWPLQTLMTGATGFTVWNTTDFGGDPLACPANLGGTALFYPGSHFGLEGPLPSIRLKILRSAVQLADLVQHFAATPARHKLEAAINTAYGRKDNDGWFTKKPPFVNTPPRYWRFDDSMGEYCLPQLYRDKPYDLTQTLASQIYSVIGQRPNNGEPGAVFRYQ